jgi:cysteinyl-tRNA synthetase, unknown class
MKRGIRRLTAAMIVCLACASCGDPIGDRDFRQDMRDFVVSITSYARGIHSDFTVIPQNGHALLTADGEPDGSPSAAYIAAIDGVGREDLFYGYEGDDVATPVAEGAAMEAFMDLAVDQGLAVMVIDYCSTRAHMDNSYAWNAERGYISFAAMDRGLGSIPPYPAAPYNANAGDVASLGDAKNFLFLLCPDAGLYPTKDAYLDAIAATDYDVAVIDLSYVDAAGVLHDLDAADLARIRAKHGGGDRLIICYMSIGEAEDYRSYWDASWKTSPPPWLEAENPDWAGNYKVRYWDPEWQAIIYGSSAACLDRIMVAGFDGVYLDIIDAYEYFEELAGE